MCVVNRTEPQVEVEGQLVHHQSLVESSLPEYVQVPEVEPLEPPGKHWLVEEHQPQF